MKKLLCIILTVLLCLSVLSAVLLPAAAADSGTLTVTDGGKTLAQVKVGSTFIFRVGLYSGQQTLINGQGVISYDTKALKPVAYGSPSPESYSFCSKLQGASPVINLSDDPGFVRYNFSQIAGITGFSNASEPYLKLRFTALKSGTTELHHTMETLTARGSSGSFVKLFQNGKATGSAYTTGSVENPTAYLGDADNDGAVSVVDATCVQWVTAGKKLTYSKANADVNLDGDVNLKDALEIRRAAAGIATASEVGGWRFASEQ